MFACLACSLLTAGQTQSVTNGPSGRCDRLGTVKATNIVRVGLVVLVTHDLPLRTQVQTVEAHDAAKCEM